MRPYGQQPTRLPCPQDSLGKNTRVGCHFLLQGRADAHLFLALHDLNRCRVSPHRPGEEEFADKHFFLGCRPPHCSRAEVPSSDQGPPAPLMERHLLPSPAQPQQALLSGQHVLVSWWPSRHFSLIPALLWRRSGARESHRAHLSDASSLKREKYMFLKSEVISSRGDAMNLWMITVGDLLVTYWKLQI